MQCVLFPSGPLPFFVGLDHHTTVTGKETDGKYCNNRELIGFKKVQLPEKSKLAILLLLNIDNSLTIMKTITITTVILPTSSTSSSITSSATPTISAVHTNQNSRRTHIYTQTSPPPPRPSLKKDTWLITLLVGAFFQEAMRVAFYILYDKTETMIKLASDNFVVLPLNDVTSPIGTCACVSIYV